MIEIIEFIQETGKNKPLGKMHRTNAVPKLQETINLKKVVYMVISVEHKFGVIHGAELVNLETTIKVIKLCHEDEK